MYNKPVSLSTQKTEPSELELKYMRSKFWEKHMESNNTLFEVKVILYTAYEFAIMHVNLNFIIFNIMQHQQDIRDI